MPIRAKDTVAGKSWKKLINPGKARVKKAGKNSITLTWNKVKGASSYIVYGCKCGIKNRYKKLKTMKGNTYIQKKLKKGKYYKYLIVAVKDGKAITTSKTIHIATTGGKVGNYKSINVKKKALTIEIGKTAKIKATAVPGSTNVIVKKHRALAYEISSVRLYEGDFFSLFGGGFGVRYHDGTVG